MVGLLNALPDTQLWKRLDREGRLLVKMLREQHGLHFKLQDTHGSSLSGARLSKDHADYLRPARIL
jgi:hypothetical protein